MVCLYYSIGSYCFCFIVSGWVYSIGGLNYLVYIHNLHFFKKLICFSRGQEILDKALSSLEGTVLVPHDCIII